MRDIRDARRIHQRGYPIPIGDQDILALKKFTPKDDLLIFGAQNPFQPLPRSLLTTEFTSLCFLFAICFLLNGSSCVSRSEKARFRMSGAWRRCRHELLLSTLGQKEAWIAHLKALEMCRSWPF